MTNEAMPKKSLQSKLLDFSYEDHPQSSYLSLGSHLSYNLRKLLYLYLYPHLYKSSAKCYLIDGKHQQL